MKANAEDECNERIVRAFRSDGILSRDQSTWSVCDVFMSRADRKSFNRSELNFSFDALLDIYSPTRR